MRPTYTTVHCEWPLLFFLFSFFGTAQQKRGYQRGAWPPNEAPGNFTMSVVTKRSPNVKRGYQRGAWPPNEAPGHQTNSDQYHSTTVHCEWPLLFFLHCVVWWPGASFGGQAPRWYPRFTLGDLFVTTLRVKWPGASFGGQAPRWYPRFCWAVPKKKEIKGAH